MNHLRAAVVRAAPVAFDRDRSLERVRAPAAEAASAGARLIVFPEAFIPGYPRGVDFGLRAGVDVPGLHYDGPAILTTDLDLDEIPGPGSTSTSPATTPDPTSSA